MKSLSVGPNLGMTINGMTPFFINPLSIFMNEIVAPPINAAFKI
jgi:hypothetical protein